MINPFTVYKRIKEVQEQVMYPLYGSKWSKTVDHDTLLVLTAAVIRKHEEFITELCNSKIVWLAFEVILMLGGASGLTKEDFKRFTSYVNDGGLGAMYKMLSAKDKYKVFVEELRILPARVQDDAPKMLIKAKELHYDFVSEYLSAKYKGKEVPPVIIENMNKTDTFITGLIKLSKNSGV